MPEGTNDLLDQNTTPAGAIDFNNGRPKRVTTEDISGAGDAGKERVRISSYLVGAVPGVLTVPGEVITVADNQALADGGVSNALEFDVTTGTGTNGAAALTGLPYSNCFRLSCRVTTGYGWLYVYHRNSSTSAWRLYERIPISPNYPVDKSFPITRAQYRVVYGDVLGDGVLTTGLDLQAVLDPSDNGLEYDEEHDIVKVVAWQQTLAPDATINQLGLMDDCNHYRQWGVSVRPRRALVGASCMFDLSVYCSDDGVTAYLLDDIQHTENLPSDPFEFQRTYRKQKRYYGIVLQNTDSVAGSFTITTRKGN